jgi:hypothetical protein
VTGWAPFAVDSFDGIQIGHHDLLDLVGLQVPDEVPLDVQRQLTITITTFGCFSSIYSA